VSGSTGRAGPAAPVEVATHWLAVLARADFVAWPALVAEDVRMRFPYSPPGIPAHCEGREACESVMRTFFAGIASFEWRDLQLYPAAEPGLVFATARSEVVLVSGRPYRNDYCFIIRVRGGKLAEYCEYFNPLPAIAAFDPGGG
jgi:uncharacterized protein